MAAFQISVTKIEDSRLSLTHTKDQEAMPLRTEENRTQDKETLQCALCGKRYTPEELLRFEERWICARCKPVYFQILQEGASLPEHFHYGGFWIRFVALMIDGVILQIPGVCINLLLTTIFLGDPQLFTANSEEDIPLFGFYTLSALLSFTVSTIYSCLFLGKYAATPGKMVCGLQVIRSNGNRISYGRAFGRQCAEMLSQILFFMGYLMAAFDVEKRALHDRLCDTRVVYKKK